MITSAFVNIWNRRAGAVSWDSETGLAAFEFDPSFLRSGLDIAPFKMPAAEAQGRIYTFPELRNSQTFKGLPGLLSDLLPDKFGNALINEWLARHGRAPDSLNPVELLCFIGTRGMGAIEIEPAVPKPDKRTTSLEISSLVDAAERILSGRKDFRTNLTDENEKAMVDILKIGSSAGGARAKAVIAYNEKTGEVRSGQTVAPKGFAHWLIKFDGVTDKQFGESSGYGKVEMAYHFMAVDCGIDMTECRIYEENGRSHFMTKRFDRLGSDEKLHVQTFCGMRHFDFNDITSYSYEQLFETMRFLELPYPQAEQLYRRMVFNVIMKNCDDHTKNFAFIMDSTGKWSLSPAYDICHAYRPGSEWVSRHSLSINGKRDNITKNDLLSVAGIMNIRKAADIISQISSVSKNWNKYAQKTAVEKKLADAIVKTLLTELKN
jgi:serine/threonine-protein kinase HipA